MPDKIDIWDDPRVQKRSAHLNGRTYGYLYGAPKHPNGMTIFLIHGFPDLSAAWLNQFSMLLELGLQIVAPDCMGYGRTDAPPYTLRDYTFKRFSDDMAELARQLRCPQIVLGGHDWGGACVARFAQYYPSLVTHLFSISTPYFPMATPYEPLTALVKRVPTFGYQIQFAYGELEEAIQSKAEIRQWLSSCLGFTNGLNNEPGFEPQTGTILENLPKIGPNKLLTARELDFYAEEYARHGIHAPLNWYRTKELNWTDENEHFLAAEKNGGTFGEDPGIDQPMLLVATLRDRVLTTDMCYGTAKWLKNVTIREIDSDHWALYEKPQELNDIIREWFETVVFSERS